MFQISVTARHFKIRTQPFTPCQMRKLGGANQCPKAGGSVRATRCRPSRQMSSHSAAKAGDYRGRLQKTPLNSRRRSFVDDGSRRSLKLVCNPFCRKACEETSGSSLNPLSTLGFAVGLVGCPTMTTLNPPIVRLKPTGGSRSRATQMILITRCAPHCGPSSRYLRG